jgi:NADH-quinone oxidoreductase subunit C
MNKHQSRAVEKIQKDFSTGAEEIKDEVTLFLSLDSFIPAIKLLRDQYGYDMLILETAVDYWPQMEPRFHLVCRLWSMAENDILGVRVPLNGNFPSLPTLTVLYPAASWFEREVWDMFGIKFEGHPDPRRLIMPYDWEGHPLRKDYPLGYEEPQFTFNFDKVAAHKPHPKE